MELQVYQSYHEESEHQSNFNVVWFMILMVLAKYLHNIFQGYKIAKIEDSKVIVFAIVYKLKNISSNHINEEMDASRITVSTIVYKLKNGINKQIQV